MPLARRAPRDEAHLFDEEAEEGGDDVMGLTASFLSVQVLRYGLSGQLPDTHGGEPDNILSSHAVLRGDNTLPALAELILSAFASALLCAAVTLVSSSSRYLGGRAAKRAAKVLQTVLAMTHAWCVYFSDVWLTVV